ncbi:MAG: murein biosynthesis integral membrane protein MurJ [Candidatus Limnocylindrales bacterium]
MTEDAFEEPAGPEAAYSPPRSSAVALAKAGLVVSGAYLVARVLGYVRVVVIGTTFGAGEDLDAFFAAFRIPDLIFQLVAAGAVASAVVPIVSGLVANDERSRAWRVVSTLINLMLAGLLVFAAIAFIWAPQLVAAITPGFSGAILDQTIELTRIMLASPILLALGAIVTATLNSERRFAASAVAPIVYNLAIIAAAVLLSDSFGVTGLALGVVAGSFGLLVVQIPALRTVGFRYAPRIDFSDDQARNLLKLLGPRVLGLSASQITMVVMTSLATGVGLGAVTAFTIAFALYQIPMGVIGIPLGIVIFPSMSRELAVGRTGSYLELVARSVRILLFVMLPIAAIGIALRVPAVDLLLGYGQFDEAAVAITAGTLLPLLLGLTGHAVIGVFARAFYARQDTRTPVMAAILAVVVNTTLGFALVGQYGLPALGLAIAIAAWIEAGVLLIVLRRREPELDVNGILWVGARSLLAAVAAGFVALFTLEALIGQTPGDKVSFLLGSAVAGLLGAAVYVGLAFALRIPELRSMSAILRDVVQRRTRG